MACYKVNFTVLTLNFRLILLLRRTKHVLYPWLKDAENRGLQTVQENDFHCAYRPSCNAVGVEPVGVLLACRRGKGWLEVDSLNIADIVISPRAVSFHT